MTYFVHSDVNRVASPVSWWRVRCAETGYVASFTQGNSDELHNVGRVS